MTRPRRLFYHLHAAVTNLVSEEEAYGRLLTLLDKDTKWGDPKWVTEEDLRKAYGPTLAKEVFEMPLSQWSEPLRSALGWHYIMVLDQEVSRPYSFGEVESRATEDHRRKLRQEAYDMELERLKKKYRVEWVK